MRSSLRLKVGATARHEADGNQSQFAAASDSWLVNGRSDERRNDWYGRAVVQRLKEIHCL